VGPYRPCCLQPLIRDGRNRLCDRRRRLPVVASSSHRELALFKTATPHRKAFASALTSTLSPLLCAQNPAAMDQARGKRGRSTTTEELHLRGRSVTMLALGAPSCRDGHRCWSGGVHRLFRQGELAVDAPSTPRSRPFLISGLHVLRFLGMTSPRRSHSTYLRVDFLGGRYWAAVDRHGGLNRTPPRVAVGSSGVGVR
jgi:hypothetical protein